MSKTTPDKEDIFVATDEWKVIPEGMPIPPGLHVKIDFQNHTKMAKLLSKDGVNKDTMLQTLDEKYLDINNGNFKKDDVIGTDTEDNLPINITQIDDDSAKDTQRLLNSSISDRKFRSMAELKDLFKKLNFHVTTDLDKISEILKNYANVSRQLNTGAANPREYTIEMIRDLDPLLDKWDNAIYFAEAGGFVIINDILIRCANDTDFSMAVYKLTGSAMQNNPQVQIQAYKSNLLPRLTQALNEYSISTSAAGATRSDEEKEYRYYKSIIFALSSLLRGLPVAQKYFVEPPLDGFTLLTKFVERGLTNHINKMDDSLLNTDSLDRGLKLVMRILTLVSDLIVEQRNFWLYPDDSADRYRQNSDIYKSFDLNQILETHDWCELHHDIIKVFDEYSLKGNLSFYGLNNFLEKYLESLTNLLPICSNKLYGIVPHIKSQINRIKKINESEMVENLELQLQNIVYKLGKINSETKQPLHEEQGNIMRNDIF
ncbi:unnamed protein product [Gordionus sp. m RMFG-2023]|uniref:nucleotide exchange factor SIL1-like n=1 Tax=Gordionus sp. m RMFG-2023 TaxID=3053472 RepID=UPI0030E20B45